MSQIAGKRLTYSELTGKESSPRYETTGTGGKRKSLLVLVGRFRFPLGSIRFILPLPLFFVAGLGTLNSAVIPRSKFPSASGLL